MLNIEIEIDGKKVAPNKAGHALEEAFVSTAIGRIKEIVEPIQCTAHKQRPKIKVVGSSLGSMEIEVEGCCSELIELVKSKLQ